MENSSSNIVRQVQKFDENDWALFAREELQLHDEDISRIEGKGSSFIQKKYEMVQKWTEERADNVIERLVELVERFLPGSSIHAPKTENTIDRSGKLVNQPVIGGSVPVSGASKGLVLIICNDLGDRSTVHEKDKELMEELWRDLLRCDLFEGKVHLNQTATEMDDLVKKFSKEEREYSYGVIIISSHGYLVKQADFPEKTYFVRNEPDPVQVIEGRGETRLIERKMMDHFHNSSAWNSTPKLFILDYCRGTETDKPKYQHKAGPIPHLQTACSKGFIPTVSEFGAIYATQGNYAAFAKLKTGPSWLIDSIYQVFKDNWDTKSLTAMLVMVNRYMKGHKGDEDCKAMSVFESTFTQDFNLY